jgi:hypothetical protein
MLEEIVSSSRQTPSPFEILEEILFYTRKKLNQISTTQTLLGRPRSGGMESHLCMTQTGLTPRQSPSKINVVFHESSHILRDVMVRATPRDQLK